MTKIEAEYVAKLEAKLEPEQSSFTEKDGQLSEHEIDYNLRAPGFQRTYWVNIYPNGQITRSLCETKQEALNRCDYTGDTPDAVQVEIRIVPLKPKLT